MLGTRTELGRDQRQGSSEQCPWVLPTHSLSSWGSLAVGCCSPVGSVYILSCPSCSSVPLLLLTCASVSPAACQWWSWASHLGYGEVEGTCVLAEDSGLQVAWWCLASQSLCGPGQVSEPLCASTFPSVNGLQWSPPLKVGDLKLVPGLHCSR